ncbi:MULTISPECIES: MFS transporter [unclassified Nocardioides]|uniref:MFS transporter n=1 Tax=unclassified Nocardioides TaxID=2615069 RepID=UPI000ADDD187|nr:MULTISPECIES: MFS transporter [unclassified Nocardioides]
MTPPIANDSTTGGHVGLYGLPTSSVTSRPITAVALIALSTLLSMSAWFSATFVVPQLKDDWGLGAGGTSALTIAVQLGFVVGALVSAATGVVDAIPTRTLISVGGLGAGLCNAGLLICDGLASALPLRVATGMFLAAVYPPAVKEVSTWFLRGRGKALSVMIGALTLGSALPHLVRATGGGVDWRLVIGTTSVLAIAGGLVVLLIRGSGPYPFPRRPFSLGGGLRSIRNRDVALANVGYVGHMWELYAMWAFVGSFIVALPAVASRSDAESFGALLAFICIGVGAAGCLLGGVMGDRWGRPRAALISLVCSGGSALLLAGTYTTAPLGLVLGVCAFWGFWVIADSAQFSAMVAESADPDYVGGAISLQLALGYITTMVTLAVIPQLVDHFSWRTALMVLAVGPAVGAVAMVVADRARSARA